MEEPTSPKRKIEELSVDQEKDAGETQLVLVKRKKIRRKKQSDNEQPGATALSKEEKRKIYRREWRRANKERINAENKTRYHESMENDPEFHERELERWRKNEASERRKATKKLTRKLNNDRSE